MMDVLVKKKQPLPGMPEVWICRLTGTDLCMN